MVITTGSEFHAYLAGQPDISAIGKSREEAIGTLLCNYPDKFSIKIAWDHLDVMTSRYIEQNMLTKPAQS